MQLREYEGMVRRDAPADRSHVEALLRLVGRRPDADLVFADAGRRAARRAVRRLFVLTRLAARTGPRALGYVAARRAARAVFAGARRPRGRRLAVVRLPQAQPDRPPHPRGHGDGNAAPLRSAAARGPSHRGGPSHRASGTSRFSRRSAALRRLARAPWTPRGTGPRPHPRDRDLAAGPGSLPRSGAVRRG